MKLNCTTPPSGTQVPPRLGGRYIRDCPRRGAAARAITGKNRTKRASIVSPPVRLFNSAFRIPHSALASPPFALPAIVQHRHDSPLLQHFDARRVAVRLAIEQV